MVYVDIAVFCIPAGRQSKVDHEGCREGRGVTAKGGEEGLEHSEFSLSKVYEQRKDSECRATVSLLWKKKVKEDNRKSVLGAGQEISTTKEGQ